MKSETSTRADGGGTKGRSVHDLPLSDSVSIRRKMVGIVLITTLAVLVVSGGALLTFEVISSRRETQRSLSVVADIVAENSAAVLIFDDHKVAQEILSGLRIEPEILGALLYNETEIVASYPAGFAAERVYPEKGKTIRHFGELEIYRPVMQGGRRVGMVFIQGTFRGTYHRLGLYGVVLVSVLASSVFLAYLLSSFLQRVISEPLLELARMAKKISVKQDFSLRAPKMSNDEIGTLTDALNGMLEQIHEAQSAVRAGEERFRTLADNMAQLAWTADELGSGTWYNQRWYDYTGTTFETMKGRGWEQVHHPDHLERVRHHLKECFEAGSIWEDTFPLRRHDGEYRWFLTRANPIRSADGKVVRWFGTNTDITAQRQIEEQLVLARDAALSAARAKDDFVAALSHELRTPLTPVLLLASDGADNPKFPDEARQQFEVIRKNVELEARLIDDLLDLTSIARGKLVLNRKRVPLHAVLADALATIQQELKDKSIELVRTLDPVDPFVLGDSVRLQQVFWNVLKNAVKFTPAGGRIAVCTHHNPESVITEISDTGIGMTPEEIGRVFEAFSQGDHAAPSSFHRFGGLGLGLAISRSVVEMHRGRIAAASAGPRQGSTFTIVLPVAAPTGDTESVAPVPRSSRSPMVVPQKVRVLLVEDHAPTRSALTHLLQRRGFEVLPAQSVAAARPVLASEPFQILMSDIGLPVGDGHELMQELRKRPVVGIALTGYGTEEDIRQTTASGFLIHLTKPVQVDALEDALTRATVELKRFPEHG